MHIIHETMNRPTADNKDYGTYPAIHKTIGELLTEYLELAKDTLEFSTYDGYRKICHGQLLPEFGKVAVRDLKPAHIRQWVREASLSPVFVPQIYKIRILI